MPALEDGQRFERYRVVRWAEYVGENHMLQVNVNRLRRKLEPDPTHPRYILTEAGVGYLLAPQPDAQTAQ
jgi:DNA-binding response OmpR family regulator